MGALLIMSYRTSPRFRAAFVRFLWLSCATSALSVGGCSLALDTEKAQCSNASDCDGLKGGEGAALVCVKGFCQAVTCQGATTAQADESCRSQTGRPELKDAHCSEGVCRARACSSGGGECAEDETCEVMRGVCIPNEVASCGEQTASTADADADCDKYEGRADYICEGKVCVPPECKEDPDCGEGVSCLGGRCSDLAWGCAGEPDDRMSEAPAKFRLKVLAFGTNEPIVGLQTRACLSALADKDCETSIADTSYDESTGWLEVTGLEPRQFFRVRITPPEATGLLTADFYSLLTPVGDTMEVGESLLVPTALVGQLDAAFESQGVKVETDEDGKLALGTLVTRIFDCQHKPADNVRITYESQSASTLTYYLDSSLVTPHTDWTESDETGVGGVINLKINGPSTISIKRGDETVASFSTLFRPGVLTNINFYPRAYGRAPE